MESALDKMEKYNSYTAPRFPAYVLDKPRRTEELLPIARHLMNRVYTFGPLTVSPGDEILVIAYAVQDLDVYETIREAFLEKGAKRVDMIYWNNLGLKEGEYSCADGWRDIGPEQVAAVLGGTESGESRLIKEYLEKERPSYTVIYGGEQGGQDMKRTIKQFRGPWLFRDYEDLISPFNHFNETLLRLIDIKLAENFALAREVHVTDPEGTDMHWTVTEEEAAIWQRAACTMPGHVVASTIQGIRSAFSSPRFGGTAIGSLRKWAPYAARIASTTNGVIAATITHSGFTPRIEVHVKNGKINMIKGGGKFGTLLEEFIEKYKNVQYPGFPSPGYEFINDCSITTNPKALRKLVGVWKHSRPWSGVATERLRGGAIHWGFGVQHDDPELGEFAKQHNVPAKHMPHFHQLFPTYEIKQADGRWLKLIDKGWLTTYDEPEVQRLARVIATPDSLLTYDWVPPIPGINMSGDYVKDYANDPVPWVKREMNGEFGMKIY